MRIWARREARSSCMSFQLLSLGETCMRTMGERDGGLTQSSSPTRTPSRFYSSPCLFSISSFPAGISNPALTPSQLSIRLFPATRHPHITQVPGEPGQILPTEHDETLEPSVCPLRYPPALPTDLTDQPGTRRKIPERQNGGKCQVLTLNPGGLEMGFAGFFY